MGICVGGIEVEVAGMSVGTEIAEEIIVGAGVGAAQDVINNRRMIIL
jgi:hypothetical protein